MKKEKTKHEDLITRLTPYELTKIDEVYYVLILDDEGDEVLCSFNFDYSVEIITDKYTYLSLDHETLHFLKNCIEKTENAYEKTRYEKNI